MTASLPRCVALLLLVLPFVPAVAVAHDDTEVERLIKQLGSDKFTEREAATKRLHQIGYQMWESPQNGAWKDKHGR